MKRKNCKIIFLDIDGVMNPESDIRIYMAKYKKHKKDFNDFSTRTVGLLNYLIEATEAKIVISSCWRGGETIESMQKIFKRFKVKCEIIGLTPHLGKGMCRGDEIKVWLDEYTGTVKQYIILDDEEDFRISQMNHFIHIDSYCGLSPTVIYKAERLLNETI